MSDFIDHAKESIHEAHQHGGTQNRNVAIIVAILAAMLALADMAEKSSQSSYLTHHISLSDVWNFYQAKSTKATVLEGNLILLETMPTSPIIVDKIRSMTSADKKLRDNAVENNGMKQLLEQAKTLTIQRDEAFHKYHQYEGIVGMLQIAIVLASVSIVTRMIALTWIGGILGISAALYCLVVWAGIT